MQTKAEDGTNTTEADVVAAFDILLEIIEDAVAAVNRDGAAAMESGEYDLVLQHADRGKATTEFHRKVSSLRDEWVANMDSVGGTADDPEEVDRLARKNLGRLPRGVRTPEFSFRQPILEVLLELGGVAPIDEVLGLVEQKIGNELKEVDYQTLPSDPNYVRWRNTAQWARHRMAQEGLLKSDSPSGIWEITEEGRRWLSEAQRGS